MAKNYSNKNRKRKALIAMLCALSVTCTGLAAACAPTEEEPPSTAVTSKEDTQLIKNGDFEHFDIPDKAIHLIKNVNSWTLGGSNSVKSGIIGTSKSDWDKLTDGELADTLNLNNDLSTDSEDYVNYNNMRSRDILYKDTYAATLEKVDGSWIDRYKDLSDSNIHGYQGYFGIKGTGTSEDPYKLNGKTVYYNSDDEEFYFDSDFTELVRKELIENPGTHYDLNEDETKVTVDGKEYDVLKDEESGNLYYKDGDGNENYFSNVLMIHNASTNSDHNGIQQYYTSNTVSLEAHTSAEISLWVKTSDLKFDKGYVADEKQEDKGAYIEVVQTVASTTVDSFKIKAINTQSIIASAKEKGETTTESNGWVKYTVYVNACDFANTSIQLRLGLGGETANEWVSGYAFFDDVQIKKYRTLDADETECTYKDHKAEIENNKTSCTLTSEEEDKIFYADVTSKNADKLEKGLHAYDFHYLIDLASIMDNDSKHNYSPIDFGNNVEVGLTTEKNSKDVEYAAAKSIDTNAKIEGVGKKGEPTDGYKLPKDVKARPTNEDIIKVLGNSEDFGKYNKLLSNVTGDNSAPELLDGNNGNTLLIFSSWGAPYTATLTDNTTFTLPNASADGKDGYLLVSFWVKTSDMNGSTAATAKIYELDKITGLVNEDSVKTLTIDTTDNKTDFEDEKDIYNGWVQCFFFVKNDAKDKDDDGNYREKTFKIDLSFGTTSIISTTSYESGYAAFANLQVLKINEDIYKLASEGTNTALFSFAKESEKDNGKSFAEALGTDDVNKGLARPNGYTGANGDNVLGSLTPKTDNKNVFVDADEKLNAGLINRDAFNDETSAIVTNGKAAEILSFFTSTGKWEDAFGENCYQPLIIINTLREYASAAKADEDTFDNGTYYIKNDDTYTQVKKGDEFDKDATYYSFKEVVNYGFVGNQKTVSANGREVISVRVKVEGNAEAYIYLVNGDDTDKILNFTTPSYTFWYDDEGNVLKEEFNDDWTKSEHLEHIVYTLRDDGLYDGEGGKLYGNLYNLVKSYKDSKYEQVAYYDENGKPVEGGYDYVEKHDGETFYKENGQIADHYLCTTDGTHVYEYIDGKYYYVEITKTDDKTTETTNKDLEVNNFDADKYARYSNPDIDEKLYVKVTKDDCDRLGDDGWVTVNFVVKAGSQEKSYRLELWSGEKDKDGVDKYDPDVKGAVAFDYSHKTVSEKTLTTYEKEIINAYNSAFNKVVPDLLKEESSLGRDANIADYEAILNSDKLNDTEKADIKTEMASYTYKASYYTYTLYDSAAYVPFNATTAGDGETGYDYDASSFSEQLAYFEFEDTANNEKNIFVDYSAVDQSISKNTLPDEEEPEEDETTNATELGLYISSIVLVVVLLITLVSILVTQYIRKRRKASGPKNSNKNVYRKRDRYVKKLHLVKDEMVEPENAESETNEVPAEENTETVEEPSSPADGEDKE